MAMEDETGERRTPGHINPPLPREFRNANRGLARAAWAAANPATIDGLMSGEMVAIEMDLLHDLRCGEGLGADVHARVAALLAATPARREG